MAEDLGFEPRRHIFRRSTPLAGELLKPLVQSSVEERLGFEPRKHISRRFNGFQDRRNKPDSATSPVK